jgi:hypothetical protein
MPNGAAHCTRPSWLLIALGTDLSMVSCSPRSRTTSGVDIPGADYQLTKLPGLRYAITFRGPSESHLDSLVG